MYVKNKPKILMCKNCFVNPRTPGYECCSKKCGIEHDKKSKILICKNCHLKPCNVENGKVYDFCSRACGHAYKKMKCGNNTQPCVFKNKCKKNVCINCKQMDCDFGEKFCSDFCKKMFKNK
jgi:hypothetical protein